jgi:hypothetical protein
MIHGRDLHHAAVNWLVALGVLFVFLKLIHSLWLLTNLHIGVPL